MRTIIAGTAVISLGIVRVLESDIGVEAVGDTSCIGLVLVAQSFGPCISGIELQVGKAINKAGLQRMIVRRADRDAGVDGRIPRIRTVVVDVGQSRIRVVSRI